MNAIRSLQPNPAREIVSLSLNVEDAVQVIEIGLYNVLGERITSLFTGVARERYDFNVQNIPSGVYRIAVSGGLQGNIPIVIVK